MVPRTETNVSAHKPVIRIEGEGGEDSDILDPAALAVRDDEIDLVARLPISRFPGPLQSRSMIEERVADT